MLMASRKPPRDAEAITSSAPGSISIPSLAAMPARWRVMSAVLIGFGQLVRLGGGQNEHGVRRRFLEGLEQGVEGLGGEHVDFVDNVDFVFALGGREINLFAQVTH
jgi:hypothetical protein